MLPELPIVIIYKISSYLEFRYRAITVSREWVRFSLSKAKPHSWRSKIRLYSFMRVFGSEFRTMSWHRFCIEFLRIKRRRRNIDYRLSWKAAAQNYVLARCRGCGVRSSSNVFGTVICMNCRRNKRKKYCYMVSVGQARFAGVPKRILDSIPWHGSRMGTRLRFWSDIQNKLDNNMLFN